MNKTAAFLLPILAVTTAQAIGAQRGPTPGQPGTAAWYAHLRKPGFTPPAPVFGIAWTGLSGLLAYAGYRMLRAGPSAGRSRALSAWGSNLLGIAGFSWVMFGRKRLDEGLGVTAGMVVSSAATVAAATRVDRRAAWATVPLLLWTVFATLLQEEVWRRNG